MPTSGSVADELREINTIIDHCGIKLALTTDSTFKALGKDYSAVMTGGLKSMPTIDWWKTNDFGSYAPPRKGPSEEFVQVQPTDIAYIEYSRNAVGDLKGVVIEHRTLLSQCFLAKTAVNFKSTDIVLSTLETRQQFGFLIGTLFSVFNGSAFNFFVDHPLPEPCTTFFRTIAQNKGEIDKEVLAFIKMPNPYTHKSQKSLQTTPFFWTYVHQFQVLSKI